MHKVQQGSLRATSISAHFVAAAYKYMWRFGLWLHELLVDVGVDLIVISASCDDNRKVTLPHICVSLCVHLIMLDS